MEISTQINKERDLDYGLSRMYEILMSGVISSSITVFREYDEAKKWLEG